jgi:lipopolysaccharide transport system ATP-binding protein
MTKDEIRKRFDEIVAFSDVERFIDTPVKRYSNGMKVRLAFAVAAHLEAEILIVDEVLAVGDVEFQKKCLAKMGGVTSEGRTILFVSHNMVAVQTLCKSAVFLNGGRVTDSGDPSSIISKYLESSITQDQSQEWKTLSSAPGNDFVKISRLRVFPAEDKDSSLITMQTLINVETKFWRLAEKRNAYLVYHLVNEQGIIVLTTGTELSKDAGGEYISNFQIPGGLLNAGFYTLRFRIIENGRQTYDNQNMTSFCVVDVAPRNRSGLGREPGVIKIDLPWQTTRSES